MTDSMIRLATFKSLEHQSAAHGPVLSRALRARVADLTALWELPDVADAITVEFSSRLSRSLGRAELFSGRIVLSKNLCVDSALLDHALCHELAHIVAFLLVGPSERVHGPTWKRLMGEAGHDPLVRLPVKPQTGKSTGEKVRRYRHRCPVCQFARIAARRMPNWRCADCAAAGLDGRLEIQVIGLRR